MNNDRLKDLKDLRDILGENFRDKKDITPSDALLFHKLGIPFYPEQIWGYDAMIKIIDYEIEKIK